MVDEDALVVWLLVSGDLILLDLIAVLVLVDGETSFGFNAAPAKLCDNLVWVTRSKRSFTLDGFA